MSYTSRPRLPPNPQCRSKQQRNAAARAVPTRGVKWRCFGLRGEQENAGETSPAASPSFAAAAFPTLGSVRTRNTGRPESGRDRRSCRADGQAHRLGRWLDSHDVRSPRGSGQATQTREGEVADRQGGSGQRCALSARVRRSRAGESRKKEEHGHRNRLWVFAWQR